MNSNNCQKISIFFFKILLFSFFFIIQLPAVFTQNIIKGIIFDSKTSKGLTGANIYIDNLPIGASANGDGTFRIELPELEPGNYKLIVSYIGYHQYKQEIKIPLSKDLSLEIPLKESMLYMDQVVVTGTRTDRLLKDTPVTTQVIKGEKISESGTSDMSQLLSEVTGVAMDSDPRFGSNVQLQGFSSSRVLLLVDGMRVIGRLNGQMDISQFSTQDIERIEVVKGATSTVYGSEAMGGVINIITKKPGPELNASADIMVGSNDLQNATITASMPIRNWTPKINASIRSYGGYDLDPTTIEEDGRGYTKYNGTLSLQGNLNSRIRLNFMGSYFAETQGRILNEFFEEQTKNNRFSFNAQGTIDSLLTSTMKVGLYYSKYDHSFNEIVRSSGFLREGDTTKDQLIRTEIMFGQQWGIQRIDFGYSFEHEGIESDRIFDKTKDSQLHNLFIEDELILSPSVSFLVGARFDHHSIYGENLSPKASVMLSPSDNQRIRLSYGNGFRAPSFKELYLTLFVSDVNLVIIGNPELIPENSNSINLDFEIWNDRNYHSRFNIFYNNVTDLISDIRLDTPDNTLKYTYINYDQVQTWGGEWDMQYFPNDWIELSLGYSYLDSYNETSGEPLGGKSKHRAQAGLILSLPFESKLNIRGQYIGEKFEAFIDEDTGVVTEKIPINGYYLVHANFSVKLPFDLKLYFGGRNLTDYVDTVYGPMPGRELYSGLTYIF